MGKNQINNAKDTVNFFESKLSSIIMINKPAREGLGEDSFYCGRNENSAIISVCDGCGGLGARTYENLSGHTGAYIASRLVSGALHDWYHDNNKQSWSNVMQMADSINSYISRAYDVCNPYASENRVIKGSLMRRLPTTVAIAYLAGTVKDIQANLIWAGDSRAYLIDRKGLAQLTRDDTFVTDALENLTSDSPMNNVVAADGNYKLNMSVIHISEPSIIITCTDGCFGYMQSPMDFEHAILSALVRSETPEEYKTCLKKSFDDYAGDDYAFASLSFGFEDFYEERKAMASRLKILESKYVIEPDTEDYQKKIKELWQEYKIDYERYWDTE